MVKRPLQWVQVHHWMPPAGNEQPDKNIWTVTEHLVKGMVNRETEMKM
jgi:hypothetical protein